MPPNDKLILVAEDNLTLRHAFVKQLERMGFCVRAATTGEEAIREASSNNFNLIFLDLMLPDLSGMQAVHAIREFEKVVGRHTPIVAVTAAEVSTATWREAGLDDVMHKPVTRERIEAVLSRWAP